MPNLNVFDTYYMAGMVQEIVPATRFFVDRYFPTGATDIFNSEKVLVEFQDGDRKLAPFVVPRAGSINISRMGYEINEYRPGRIAPSRLMTIDDLKQRGFGEAILSNSTPADRARALQLKDLTDLNNRISRREEWLAVQTLLNYGVTMRHYIDDGTNYVDEDLYFYNQASGDSNPTAYTVGDEWDDTNGDFWGDVEAMCDSLGERGLPAEDLIVSSDVGRFIMDDAKVKAYLDNRRYEMGEIRPKNAYHGVTWIGMLNFGGYELNVFVVKETYKNDSGVTQKFLPDKSAIVTAPGCGHTMYGAITQMEANREYETFAMKRVPKLIVDEAKDTRALRLASRPLCAPVNNAPWMYAANVLK